eukprot:jgi/Mesvir1/23420/Mv21106-RA.1
MAFEMTPASLKKICKEAGMYTSLPELNDVLHLQCKGITDIKGLEAYTGLRTLYLECNVISEIQGLDHLSQLSTLYLNQNMITTIRGLGALHKLQTLDLSENMISKLESLSCLPSLRQLNLASNRLHDADSIVELKACPSLTSLDLSKNQLEDPDVLEVLASIPLTFLRLVGNPVVSKTAHYRKHLLTVMPQLNYLDDRPAFEEDRRAAVAFSQGGLEAERAMRETIRVEKAAERERHRKAFDDMLEAAKARMAAAREEAMQAAPVLEAAVSLASTAQAIARETADLAADLARVLREIGEAAEAQWKEEEERRRQEQQEQEEREERERLWLERLRQVKEAVAAKQQQAEEEGNLDGLAGIRAASGGRQGSLLKTAADGDGKEEPLAGLALDEVLARARADAVQYGWAQRDAADRDNYGRLPRGKHPPGWPTASDDSSSDGSSDGSHCGSSEKDEGSLKDGSSLEGSATAGTGTRTRGGEDQAGVAEDARSISSHPNRQQQPPREGDDNQQLADQDRPQHRVSAAFRDELQARLGQQHLAPARNGVAQVEPWPLPSGAGPAGGAAVDRQRLRPLIWGTSRYASLWSAAVGLGEQQEQAQQRLRAEAGEEERVQELEQGQGQGQGQGSGQGGGRQGEEEGGHEEKELQGRHASSGTMNGDMSSDMNGDANSDTNGDEVPDEGDSQDGEGGESQEEAVNGDREGGDGGGVRRALGHRVGNGVGSMWNTGRGGGGERPSVREAWGERGAHPRAGSLGGAASYGNGLTGGYGPASSRDGRDGDSQDGHRMVSSWADIVSGANRAVSARDDQQEETDNLAAHNLGHVRGDESTRSVEGSGRAGERCGGARQEMPNGSGHASVCDDRSSGGSSANGEASHDNEEDSSRPVAMTRASGRGSAADGSSNSSGARAVHAAGVGERGMAGVQAVRQAWQPAAGANRPGVTGGSPGGGGISSNEARQGPEHGSEIDFEELD